MSSDSKPKLRYRYWTNNVGKVETTLEPVNRGEIVWTAWCRTGYVLHIVPIYCGSRTVCGRKMYRFGDWWKTAWGIPEDKKDQICYSCLRTYARELVPWEERRNFKW